MLKIARDVACDVTHVNARVARRNQDSRAPFSSQLHAILLLYFTLIERMKIAIWLRPLEVVQR